MAKNKVWMERYIRQEYHRNTRLFGKKIEEYQDELEYWQTELERDILLDINFINDEKISAYSKSLMQFMLENGTVTSESSKKWGVIM